MVSIGEMQDRVIATQSRDELVLGTQETRLPKRRGGKRSIAGNATVVKTQVANLKRPDATGKRR
jgi:hypothetical protein